MMQPRSTATATAESEAATLEPLGLADVLRATTRKLHTKAERSGVIRDILNGNVDLYGYALLLRNLLPAYETMERELNRRQQVAAFQLLAHPVVYRTSALRSDLVRLSGDQWHEKLALLPAGRLYARHIASTSNAGTASLIGHIYTRYLGDLNGGQILQRRLQQSLSLDSSSLAFYSYPMIADLENFKTRYRDAIDQAGHMLENTESAVQTAKAAFQHNIAVSVAVQVQYSVGKVAPI